MKTYMVTATRWEHGWELDIEGMGVTQARSVRDAEVMVRDHLRLDGVTGRYAVEIDYHADDAALDTEIGAIQRDARRAAEMQTATAQRARAAARTLRRRKYSGTEIAAVLGVSKQRVSQLLKEPRRNG